MAEQLGYGDLAEVVARFGAELRRAGLPVGPGRCERFAGAVTLARPRTPDDLYLCALATLVSGRDQIAILRGVFNQVFGGLTDDAARPAPRAPTGTTTRSPSARSSTGTSAAPSSGWPARTSPSCRKPSCCCWSG